MAQTFVDGIFISAYASLHMANVHDSFGDRLKLARGEAGLSQMDLATKTGVHLMTISSWERTGRLPRAELIRSLTHVLGVDYAWLAFGEGQMR